MAKKTKEEALSLDAILFKCRDILRQAKNSGSFFEKRDMMLTLVFLRFIGEKYEDGLLKLRQTLQEQGLDPDDPNIQMAFFEDATFADGTFPLAPEARWSTIIDTPAPQLNVALDTALRSIGETNPTLKGCFVEGTFTQRNRVIDFIAVHQRVVHHSCSTCCRFVPLVIIAGAVVDSELTEICHAHLESLRLQIAVYCGECLSCVGCGLHFAVDKVVKRHDKFLVVLGYCYSVIIFHVLMI